MPQGRILFLWGPETHILAETPEVPLWTTARGVNGTER